MQKNGYRLFSLNTAEVIESSRNPIEITYPKADEHIMNCRMLICAIIITILPLFVSCGGKLYDVAPLPGRAPVLTAGDPDGLRIGARALDSDGAFEAFSANLPLAGVMAVEVDLSNNSSAAVKMKKLKFELSGGSGEKFKRISSKKALSRVMDYYGVSFYRKDARARTREDYNAVELKTDGELNPQEERRGYVFFRIPAETDIPSPLVLNIKGSGEPIRIELRFD